MALTPEEVKRMEEQANLSDRFNKASDRYVAGNDPRLRAMEREQVLRQREGDVFAQARQRALDSKMMTAVKDPGRYSAFETRALQERFNQQGLRQHELAMLRQEGADKIGVAHETALGMRGQGAEAAGIRANADKEIAYNNSLTQEEIAGINAESAERIAGINTKSALEIEQERQKGALGVAKEQGRASDYAADARVDEQAEKNKGLITQHQLNMDLEAFKQKHEKELAQIRVSGQLPNSQEMTLIMEMTKKPENEGRPIRELLEEIRYGKR